MSTILVKILATALTLGQVTTRPEAVRTEFDSARDRTVVAQVLKDGCAHMRKAFDIEDINLDDLIATAMEDPQAVTGDVKVLQGVNLNELHVVYRQFCKGETVADSPVDLGAVIDYYNKAVADLPDHKKLKGLKLSGVSVILDARGERFTEVFEPDQRRISVPLKDIPEHVQKAFVAAEDKRFYQHKGIDERGVIRAFVGNLAQPGRPQGGSTITQQVAKNLLVGDDVTYERKMREMIVASRIERTLTKPEILEIYLNSIYLGRASWGVEMAAQSYFGKPAKALTLEEGALLAGLTKGPNYYNPDRQPERAQERFAYVLSRLNEDGVIPADRMKQAFGARPQLVALDRVRRNMGFHFVDYLDREAKTVAGIESLTAASHSVRATLIPALQRATESALQEGLARYELNTGRMSFTGAEINLSEAIGRIATAAKGLPGAAGKPAWLQALEGARPPLYDVHWPTAVVLDKRKVEGGGEVIRIGLRDGRVLPLTAWNAPIRRALKLHDVVHVRVIEASAKPQAKGKGKAVSARAELRVRPAVQGAAIVLENKTGRILAMAGGFSYPLSQLNRATQAHRQPGSAFKPIVYLAALGQGLQPNTLIWDTPVTLPPVGGYSSREQDYWTPKNYDSATAGLLTLRGALEHSKNLVTARLLDGAITSNPERSLQRVCELAMEAQLYIECVRHYPFVLGAQPVRIIDLAAFYAAIANEGVRPSPYAIEMIEQGGNTVYARVEKPPVMLGSADRVAFYQMKTILQGVLERGTARSIRHLAPYVAGKTGTTDNENDAWFAGFTNEVSVVVWVGHDNADGKRRTLGRGQTGGKVAIPIFESIIQAAWAHHAPKTALNGPSPEAQRQLIALTIDPRTGDRVAENRPGAFKEYFRLERWGRLAETQYKLVPREEAYAFRHPDPWGDGEASGGGWADDLYRGLFGRAPVARDPRPDPPAWRGPSWARPWWEDDERPRRRQRRIDPDYPWGNRQIY
jgi:penicillin-binding protein 1A